MTQTVKQRKALKRLRCPPDVTRQSFEDMVAHIPRGAEFVKSEVPRSRFHPPHWRDFWFRFVEKPAAKSLKKGDTLVLSCPRKLVAR